MTVDANPYIVLISGGGRGLGRGYVAHYLLRPNHLVIAANRNPDNEASKSLFDLPKGVGSRLVVVKLDSTVEADSAAAVKQLEEAHGIDHLDLVIANAGGNTAFPFVRDVTHAELQSHLDMNVFGVLFLFQATRHLLQKAREPKWVTIGSGGGSISAQPPAPSAAYGPSKAAIHWITRRIHFEEEYLTAFVEHPGWIQNEGGLVAAKCWGLDDAMVQQMLLKEADYDAIIRVIDQATRETHGGKFLSYEGKEQPW